MICRHINMISNWLWIGSTWLCSSVIYHIFELYVSPTINAANQIYANLSILHFLIYIFVCSVRFIFCRAVLSLYSPTNGKEEFLPRCLPHLPESVAPESAAVQSVITQIADMFGSADRFVFPETKAHLKPGSEITKSEGNPSH